MPTAILRHEPPTTGTMRIAPVGGLHRQEIDQGIAATHQHDVGLLQDRRSGSALSIASRLSRSSLRINPCTLRLER